MGKSSRRLPAGYHGERTILIGGKRIDGRTEEARRFIQIVKDLTAQLGEPAAGEQIYIERLAAAIVKCDLLDAKHTLHGELTDPRLRLDETSRAVMAGLVRLGLVRKNSAEEEPEASDPDDHAAAILAADQ